MRKNKLLLLLALLMTAATGAWADETPLLTIESTDYTSFTSGSKTFDNKVTVTFSNTVYNDGDDFGWYTDSPSLLTVAGTNGYTITSCKFYTEYDGTAMTGYTVEGESPSVYLTGGKVFTDDSETMYLGSQGITKIEVYTAAAPAGYTVSLKDGVKDADKWTISPNPAPEGSPVTIQYTGRLKVKGVTATSDAAPAEEPDPLAVPMTIEAITAGSIKVSSLKEGMQYSLDGGKTKNAVTTDDIVLNVGDKVQFYGNGTSITSYNNTTITGIGDGFTCKVYGNIMSLVDEENFATAKTLSENHTFRSLFKGNSTLTDASGLLLPATQLAQNCYYQMFYDCTALTAAPALPATQLAASCYRQMFQGCSALTAAPELPATQLAAFCYQQMFQGCIDLTASPVLPATQLASNCYYLMFSGCSKLATVTCLATSGIDQNYSTYNWLRDAGSEVEDTKTVYTSSSASWSMNNNNGIPVGWERVDIDN